MDIEIEQQWIKLEVDTGSGISTIPLMSFKTISPQHELFENDVRLKSATCETFQPHSYANVSVIYGGEEKILRLYLMKDD